MVTYNEQLNADASTLGRFLLAAVKVGAAFLIPVAIAIGAMFAFQRLDEVELYIASAMYTIAGLKFLVDAWMLYSLRLYRGEFTVNRELNNQSVKSWFKWTGFATIVAVATAVAIKFAPNVVASCGAILSF